MAERQLNIPQQFLLMILDEETGYFYQLESWNLSCAIVAAVLADLTLQSRIDMDQQSLILLDSAKTGDPILDPCLEAIASHSGPQEGVHYWIEKLTVHSNAIIDDALKSLVDLDVLKLHEGEFYSINESVRHREFREYISGEGSDLYIKSRIGEAIFTDTIPDPEECFMVALLNACDVLRLIFELDEKSESRVEWICKLELVSRELLTAVNQAFFVVKLRPAPLTKKIPKIPLKSLLSSRHLWDGNLPALFANFADRFGPVFQIDLPFQKTRTFIAGPDINRWVRQNARRVMTSGTFFRQVEKACGANGLIPSLDGANHFQFRKLMAKVYSIEKIQERTNDVCRLSRKFMADQNWQAGSKLEVQRDTRLMINLQMFEMLVNTDAQDLFEELARWNERAIICYVGDLLPKFLAHTPAMKRRFRLYEELLKRIEQNQKTHERTASIQGLRDELIALHGNDPQSMPEQNLPFMLAVTPVFQSIYLGDSLGFAVFEMARRPEIAARIREEANAVFNRNYDSNDKFTLDKCDTTYRFIMECLRLYPIISMMVRNVANSCVFENYSLPLGERLYIIQTASHYMNDCFPEPYEFDIDRYLPSRGEHRGPGYAPFGLDTHSCMGRVWVHFQLAITLLNIAYYFELEPLPMDYKLKIGPMPGLSITKKIKVRIANQLRELPA